MSKLETVVLRLRRSAAFMWRSIEPRVKLGLVLVLALVLVSALLNALAPLALKMSIDAFAQGPSGASEVILLLALYVGGQWIARLSMVWRESAYSRAAWRITRTLNARLFDRIMHLPLRFHLERKTGAVNQTVTNGVQGLQMILQQLVVTILPVTIELWAVTIILVQFGQAQFVAIFLALILCYGGWFALGVIRMAAPARAATGAQLEVAAAMTDSMLNYDSIKYFCAERLFLERFERALGTVGGHWFRYFRVRSRYGVTVACIFGVFFALTILYAGWRTLHGLMTVGDFVLITVYVFQVVRPIEMLGAALQQLAQGYTLLDKVIELLDQPMEPQLATSQQAPVASGELCFENVTLSYEPGRTVLRGVNLHVRPGRTLGIVGMSGSGKSTLVRLLFRLLEPDSGRILLDGVPVGELSLPQLRAAIAVVPQDAALFNDTLHYNIQVGKADSAPLEVEHAARLARLHELIANLPLGYETRVGERGVKLSGGERQRVAIARAVLKQPLIYVFDEATSSLDSHTERDILSNLREISRGSTTLVIAHRLSAVMHADQIVVLDDGVVAECGTHSYLLARGGKYAALWRAQQSGSTALREPALAHQGMQHRAQLRAPQQSAV